MHGCITMPLPNLRKTFRIAEMKIAPGRKSTRGPSVKLMSVDSAPQCKLLELGGAPPARGLLKCTRVSVANICNIIDGRNVTSVKNNFDRREAKKVTRSRGRARLKDWSHDAQWSLTRFLLVAVRARGLDGDIRTLRIAEENVD